MLMDVLHSEVAVGTGNERPEREKGPPRPQEISEHSGLTITTLSI